MLTIKRGGVAILNANPDQSDYVEKQRNGIDYCTLNFEQIGNTPVDLKLDDTVSVLGTEYHLISQVPVVTKVSDRRYTFNCIFEAEHYKLKRIKYFYINNGSNVYEKAFTITGNLELFVSLLHLNIDREFTGKWPIGDVDVTEVRTISFDNQNCLAAISTLVSEFQTEFWIGDDGAINFTSKAKNNGLVFEYGQGKGLYSIVRSNFDDSAPITKLWAYGGARNLPSGYRDYATSLQLDAPIENVTGLPLNEETITFPEIYPRLLSMVTSVGNEFTFSAADFPFNLNDQLQPGVSAKVLFQTGLLAGYEIEVSSFANDSKTFVINTVESETSLVIPSDTVKAEVGDTFVVVDIIMPEVYVTDAEALLLQFATDYYNSNNFHKRNYEVSPDKFYFRDRGIKLEVADTVRLIDTPLMVDRLISIESFKTFYAQTMGEWSNEITLSDYPIVDAYTKLVRAQIKNAVSIAPKPPVQSPKVFTYEKSGAFTRNNCPTGQDGQTVLFKFKYVSSVSYEDAVNMAESDAASFSMKGQEYANQYGSCAVPKEIVTVTLTSLSLNGVRANFMVTADKLPYTQLTVTVLVEGNVSGVAQNGDATILTTGNRRGSGSTNPSSGNFSSSDQLNGYISNISPAEDDIYQYVIG